MWKIFRRFLMHIAFCFPLQVGLFYLFTLLHHHRTGLQYWIPSDRNQLLTWCGLLVAALLPIRELFDLYYENNSFRKGIFDIVSWWVGATISTVLLHFIGG